MGNNFLKPNLGFSATPSVHLRKAHQVRGVEITKAHHLLPEF